MKGSLLPTVLVLFALVTNAVAGPFDDKPDATAGDINKALGLNVFSEKPLWEERETAVARRLGWPEESRTAELASYRQYAARAVKNEEGAEGGDSGRAYSLKLEPIPVAGRGAYSTAFYATEGKPEMISIVFSNKGDISGRNELEEAIEADEEAIEAALTQVLGKGRRDSFGKRRFRERITRWDWGETALLLASLEDNYVALRIVPTEVADNAGVGEIIHDRDMAKLLADRVEKRPNGDVVVTEIPMVDQGPKGYCVPATWERYLRYLKIPADMYVLAMAAETDPRLGTSPGALDESVDDLAQIYKRRVKQIRGDVDMREVQRYIDQGLPLIWGCWVSNQWEDTIDGRVLKRRETPDVKEWHQLLTPFRDNAEKASRAYARQAGPDYRGGGHLRMIIGYNEETGEFAISDSWGKRTAERWITEEEAQAMSLGKLLVIKY